MITRYKIFKENLLKPTTSIEDKILKTIASNKALLLENEELIFNDILYIDETWDFELNTSLIKIKKIKGNVLLHLNYIPNWLKDIEIDGDFGCSHCNLTSLENCPKIINGGFFCRFNKLTSLDDGPTHVSGWAYMCDNNSVKFNEEYVRSICKVDSNTSIKV